MRFLAFAALAVSALAATPAQASTVDVLAGAGTGTATVGSCTTPTTIIFQVNVNGIGVVAFVPQSTACGGDIFTLIASCQRTDGTVVCEGPAGPSQVLTFSNNGTFTYESPLPLGGTFRVDGTVAYGALFVP